MSLDAAPCNARAGAANPAFGAGSGRGCGTRLLGHISNLSGRCRDNRSCAIIACVRSWPVAEIELHDEVVKWMAELDDTDWQRVVVIIERLAMLGATARMPLSRSLGEGVFELRFTLGPTSRRITYRFTRDGRIILLTTFRKQRQNERAEVARAHQVAQDCKRRYP